MKIFICTNDFLKTESLIGLCNFIFNYGTITRKNPGIFVRYQYRRDIFKSLPQKGELFVFIIHNLDITETKEILSQLRKDYGDRGYRAFVVVNQDTFSYKDLGIQHAYDAFGINNFFNQPEDSADFKEKFSNSMLNYIWD